MLMICSKPVFGSDKTAQENAKIAFSCADRLIALTIFSSGSHLFVRNFMTIRLSIAEVYFYEVIIRKIKFPSL